MYNKYGNIKEYREKAWHFFMNLLLLLIRDANDDDDNDNEDDGVDNIERDRERESEWEREKAGERMAEDKIKQNYDMNNDTKGKY